jgi:pyridoxine 4-dehydrogenase
MRCSRLEVLDIGPIDARASGQFKIGDTTINRLGYGAMRLTGPGIWGAPSDRGAALATLRRLHEIGVNFIDTADSYGPDVSEELIREALPARTNSSAPCADCWTTEPFAMRG